MDIAKRDDWKTEPMPEECERISVPKEYSYEEFDRIAFGIVPLEMEDKWFIYYEKPWLYLHRSWTGFCIFRVRFEQSSSGVCVVEAFVNRRPDQYAGSKDEAAYLVGMLDIRSWGVRLRRGSAYQPWCSMNSTLVDKGTGAPNPRLQRQGLRAVAEPSGR
jgi:hypothetical protein